MTYEDVKRQRVDKEKSCNLQKPSTTQGPPAPLPPGGSAKWNNETSKDDAAAAAAAAKDARDFKRVHFNLETLNTRRLLARIAASEAKGGGAKSEGEEPAKPKTGLISRPCENGGPAASLASLVLSLPSSSSATSNVSTRPNTTAPPTVTAAPPPEIAPPQPGELQELQDQIEEMREKLRTALARRAEIQTTLAKPVAPVNTNNLVPVTTTTTVTMTMTTTAPPTVLSPIAPAKPLPANTKCVTTMTDPPHKVLSKVRPLHSRVTNQRR
ncbi:hypothetical protein INR49_008837 [Caranx melampygus]|nr:hypothetical protein INR49_008837 [Caranx melampygus]